MTQPKIDHSVIRIANVNGTGSASANALFYQGSVSDEQLAGSERDDWVLTSQ